MSASERVLPGCAVELLAETCARMMHASLIDGVEDNPANLPRQMCLATLRALLAKSEDAP